MVDAIELSLLPSIQVSPIVHNNINFDIVPDVTSDTIVALINQKKQGTEISEINDQNFLQTIGKEITFAIGLNNADLYHLRWTLHIQPSVGVLKAFSINVKINKMNVNMFVNSISLTQQIPKTYDTRQHCARTGNRRYGLVGPRSMECNTYFVEHDLTSDEISRVQRRLTDKMHELMGSLE